MLKFIFVFFATCFVDIAWTFYFYSVEGRKALKGASWAVIIYVFGAFIVS
jgi:hypothetical protein